MITEIRNWFASCPILQKETILNVDTLGADPVEYEIAPLSCDPIVKKYTDGSSIRQFQFAFASREKYDGEQNMQNTSFYEQLQSWVEEQSENGNLPALGNGRKARAIQILSCGLCIRYRRQYCHLPDGTVAFVFTKISVKYRRKESWV